jgi:regulatory protein
MSDNQQKQAWITALRFLAATPKSSEKLTAKLLEKGYPEAIVRETVVRLESKGLLSDRAYAQNIVAKYSQENPSGMRRIRFELKKRRVPEAVCAEVLAAVDPESENERAREVGLLRWQRFESLPIEKRKKKIHDFLLRRGFEFDMVRKLIDEFSRAEK